MTTASHTDLPAARIRCSAGRIQVGSCTFQSATDALSAYIQQFEPGKVGGVVSGSLHRDGPLSAVIHRSHEKLNPANVTALLTGSAENGTVPDNVASLGSPRMLNGVGTPHRSTAKHSVTFAVPDDSLLQHSKLSASLGVSGSSHNVSSQRQLSSSLFDSRFHSMEGSNSTTLNRPSDLLGLPKHSSTSATVSHYSSSYNISGRPVSQSNALASNGQLAFTSRPALVPKLIHNRQQVKTKVLQTQTQNSFVEECKRARSEVEMLLTESPTQSEVKALGQMSAGEGKLRSMLQDTSIPHETSSTSSSDKSILQQEVEQALSRSAQLLETIKLDVLVSPSSASDVGSLSTDVLLSINPSDPAGSLKAATTKEGGGGRDSRSRHRYSYHTSAHQPRSVSVGPVMGGPESSPFQKLGRRRSIDSLESTSLARQKVLDLSESLSALSDSESILKRLQGVSADTGKKTDLRDGTGPPSWIQELMPPTSQRRDLTDSLFSGRDVSGGRKAPSWVNGLDQSEAGSSVNTHDLQDAAETLMLVKELHGVDTVRKAFQVAINNDDSVVPSDLSYAGSGLNYSDLASSPAVTRNRGTQSDQHQGKSLARVIQTQSFDGMSNSLGSLGPRRPMDRSKPPVTMSRVFQDLAGVETTRPRSHNLLQNLSSSLSAVEKGESTASILRRKVCEDSADFRRSMDRLLEGGDGLGCGWGAGLKSEIPRCSTMMENQTGGEEVDVPSNVTGASSITRDSNLSNKLCLDDPSLTPARHSQVLSVLRDTRKGEGVTDEEKDKEGKVGEEDGEADLLEGDRPWEKMAPSFKSPVYVGSSSPTWEQTDKGRPETPTLSGGQQPGSMETLKQMLFRLQNEESSYTPTTTTAAAAVQQNGDSHFVPALKDYDFEVEPGGQSLERALLHLGRLKTLVQTGTVPMSPAQPSA